MKKMFAIACVSLVATFAFYSMASADPSLSGTYEMIASGICNHSTLGWIDAKGVLNGPVPPWKPAEGTHIWAANATIQATVQFKRDNTGTMKGTNYISLLPGGDCTVAGVKEYQVSQAPVSATFKYEITNGGEITIIIDGAGLVISGMISPDFKVINMVNANQILNLTGTPYKSYAIQNMVRVFNKVGN